MLYTTKIPNLFNFTGEKRVNRDIFGKQIQMEDVVYSHILTKLSVFVQLSILLLLEFSEHVHIRVFFALILENNVKKGPK